MIAVATPDVYAQDSSITLDPITVVTTAPVRRSAPSTRSGRTTAAPQLQASQAPPPAAQATTDAPTQIMPGVEALGPVSTIRPAQINTLQPTRPSDLLTTMPGVAVPERGDDPGTAINIRGLQDFGRVNVLVDGARQNFQRSGHNANGMFYIDPELISTIDVIRGPVANVYGSGAIGGVASFRTKDVEDVLKAGERWGVLAHGLGSTNIGGVGSLFAAARVSPNAEIFAGGSYRNQGDYRDGNGNIVPNTHSEVTTGVVKGTYRPADGHQFKLGYINYYADYTTGQPYPPGTPPPSASIYGTNTKNELATGRWTYARPDDRVFNFDANIYWNKTETDQTKTAGTGDAATGFIGDRRAFTINTDGVDVNNTSLADFGLFKNALTVGLDGFKDEVQNLGFGTVFTPNGERTVGGGFLQTKTNAGGVFELISAARYDRYELSGGGIATSGERLSPKFTLGLTAIRGVTPYAIYAEGYRAPAVTETLVAGIHPAPPQFTLLPNPGLQPEVGRNKEVGVNLRYDNIWQPGDAFRAKFNVYRNDIANYIDLKFLGPFRVGQGGQLCFNLVAFFCEQYQNIPAARIQGFEFETLYDAGGWFAGLSGTLFQTGRDIANNLPLASIPPDWVAGAVGARLFDRRLTMMVRWQYVTAKDPSDIPPGAEAPAGALQGPPYAYYPTGSYNLVNAYIGYQINPDTLASLAIENLLNRQYARYLNVSPNPSHGANSTPLPLYSPGLTIKAALTYRFSDQTLNPAKLADLRAR
ncbi:MAG: TonB-dependent hemoglobin/transferrin/lactoferrin family receptor [Hyphomicrobiales bacterium]|nr:TonB-dependent hemoglobin/transferrin/lactoferrin family receptor [Hyphomicrobiales bacterium]